MALHTTLHLHNVPTEREADYATWFDGPHRAELAHLRGFHAADRYEVTREQIMSMIPHPWRYLSVYDFDLPDAAIDVPALGPLIAVARDADLIAVKKLVETGELNLDGLITHRQEASDAPSAYRTAFTDPSCLKMILDWRAHS